jgi:hypothetical protein
MNCQKPSAPTGARNFGNVSGNVFLASATEIPEVQITHDEARVPSAHFVLFRSECGAGFKPRCENFVHPKAVLAFSNFALSAS